MSMIAIVNMTMTYADDNHDDGDDDEYIIDMADAATDAYDENEGKADEKGDVNDNDYGKENIVDNLLGD
jgi:hypothetical protein